MKMICCVLILSMTTLSLFCESEIKTEKDFDPILVKEAPLTGLFDKEEYKIPGLAISGTGVALGATLTVYYSYSILDANYTNSTEIQDRVLLMTSSLLFTAVSNWFLQHFIELE